MTIFQGYDGELRIIEYGFDDVTYHLEVLFCEMDFTGPIGRKKQKETLIFPRGILNYNYFREEDDYISYLPLSLSFSCRLADTVNTHVLSDWISGCTVVGGVPLTSFKGKTSLDGITCPDFDGNTSKYAYRIEILWELESTYGIRYDEVWFDPNNQKITEQSDNLILSCNGSIYGGISRIVSFTSGTSSIVDTILYRTERSGEYRGVRPTGRRLRRLR